MCVPKQIMISEFQKILFCHYFLYTPMWGFIYYTLSDPIAGCSFGSEALSSEFSLFTLHHITAWLPFIIIWNKHENFRVSLNPNLIVTNSHPNQKFDCSNNKQPNITGTRYVQAYAMGLRVIERRKDTLTVLWWAVFLAWQLTTGDPSALL